MIKSVYFRTAIQSLIFAGFVAAPGSIFAEEIHLKAKQGKIEDVIAELEAGVPIDLPASSFVTVKGVSPLFVASQFGHADLVSELLRRGADPDISFGSTENGSVPVGTALHAAAGNNRLKVVHILIAARADLEAYTYVTGTPLHLARARGYREVENALIAAGAQLSWRAADASIRLSTADVDRGKVLAKGCEQCHGVPSSDLTPGENGPNLWGIVDRAAGHMVYDGYSVHLAQASFDWTTDALNSYLASPYRFLPGTKKYPTEIGESQDRADVIAYLRTLSD